MPIHHKSGKANPLTEQSDAHFALKAAGLGVWKLDPGPNLFYWDDRCGELFGLANTTEIPYEQALSQIHSDDQKRVDEAVRRAMDSESGGRFDVTYRKVETAEDQLQWVRLMGQSEFTSAGGVSRFAGVAQEVTEEVKDQQHRQRLEQHVTDSRQRLESVLEHSPVAFALFRGPEFIIELANERVLEYWGRTRDAVMNKPLFKALPEASGQGFEELLTGVYTTGERFVARELAVTLERKGQFEQTYIDFVYEPSYEMDHNVDAPLITGVTVICVEVTETVRVRQRIEQSEARFRRLVEQAPAAMLVVIGEELVIETINQSMLTIMGRDADIVGKPLEEAIPELSGQALPAKYRNVLHTGEAYYGWADEAQVQRNGRLETGYYNVSYTPLYEGSVITGVMQVATEVTDRVLTRRALQDEKNRLNTILNELPIGVLMANATGELMYGNRQVEQIFRHPFHESRDIEAYTKWQLFDPATDQPFALEQMPMVRTLRHGETVTGLEIKLLRGDGTWGYASVNTVPVYDSTGQLQYGVFAFVDITEQKRAEAALNESELKYHTLFNEMDEGYGIAEVLVNDVGEPCDYRVLEANPQLERLTGMSRERLLSGQTMRQIAPEVEEKWYRLYGNVALTGEPLRSEELTQAWNRWYDVYVFRIGDPELRRIAIFYKEITERKHGEANLAFLTEIADELSRLSTAEEIMQTVGAKIGVYLSVKSCLFVDVDDARGEVHVFNAWNTTDVPSLHYQTIRLSDYISDVCSRTNRAEDVVVRDTQADPRSEGKNYAVLGIGAFVIVPFHRQGEWTNYLAVTDSHARDWQDDEIELFRELANRIFPRLERARAEDRLRRSEEQLRIVMESITDHALITTDTQRRITGWNQGAQHLFGFTSNEALGQLEDIIFTPEDRASGVPQQEVETARREGKAFDERYHMRKDGSRLYVSGVQSPLYTENGTLVGYVKVARDLTERRQMEQALRQADQRKDEFLATLAHELRNPLAPLRNTLQILTLTADENERLTSSVDLMTRQVDQLVRLIDDLLDVSRISRGTVQLRPERIDLRVVVEQAVNASRPLYQADGRVLTVELPSTPLYIQGDMTRLIQVVSNLLNNAAKFTYEGGRVWLTLERADGESNPNTVRLRVRDDGIGIAPDQLERIFDLFAQADTTLERSHNGLGLGLTLVRQLVELHGGRVMAHSKGIGQGSEFTVYLPALAESPKSQPAPGTVANQPTGGQKILVIDDNRDAATTLAMLLKLKGYQSHARYGGQEGIAAAETLRPDMILLDIGMPGLNGYDTCRLIREQPWGRSMVVIALTGYGQEEDKRLSREAGFDSHLVKPVDLAALLQLLASSPASRS